MHIKNGTTPFDIVDVKALNKNRTVLKSTFAVTRAFARNDTRERKKRLHHSLDSPKLAINDNFLDNH